MGHKLELFILRCKELFILFGLVEQIDRQLTAHVLDEFGRQCQAGAWNRAVAVRQDERLVYLHSLVHDIHQRRRESGQYLVRVERIKHLCRCHQCHETVDADQAAQTAVGIVFHGSVSVRLIVVGFRVLSKRQWRQIQRLQLVDQAFSVVEGVFEIGVGGLVAHNVVHFVCLRQRCRQREVDRAADRLVHMSSSNLLPNTYCMSISCSR